jgi:hypothetical protein
MEAKHFYQGSMPQPESDDENEEQDNYEEDLDEIDF